MVRLAGSERYSEFGSIGPIVLPEKKDRKEKSVELEKKNRKLYVEL